MKSEPATWSWTDQCRDNVTCWDGVRNYQARKYIQQMSLGDLCFFYHSGKDRAIVGIVSVCREPYPDPADLAWCAVDVQTDTTLAKAVTLFQIKSIPDLSSIPLVRQSRLSVMPIDEKHWKIILALSQ